MKKLIKRRDMLTGLTGFGVGSLVSIGLLSRKTEAAETPSDETDLWKYAKIDPVKVADLAYDIYPDGACMYATVRALLTAVADSLRLTDPVAASVIRGFPFQMMKYGHAGIGMVGSTCGTFNGAAAVIGLFVKDATRRDMMIQELATYYESTELPIYKPKDDKFPDMKTVLPESVLCHVSSTRWRIAADAQMFSPKRAERCRRLSADIATKTAELLNRDHADKQCTFIGLPQLTASCVECHASKGKQADTIVRMNCASCHNHNETHSNKYK
jgi:hypothetical protein